MKLVASGCGAVIVGCFLLLGTADAGWVIHSKDTGSFAKAETEVTYFQRNRVRTEVEGSANVMDFAAKKILFIDKSKKEYGVMTFEEFRRMVRQGMKTARTMMDDLKQQGIPVPETASRPKGKVVVSRLSGATIAGYACDGYRISVGGSPREDVWVTKKIDLLGEIGPGARKEFEDFSREMKGMAHDDYEMSPEYRNILESGYPMKVVDKDSDHVQEVTRVEKKDLPASLFEEPKEYKKVPMEKMMFGSSEGMPPSGKAAPRRGDTAPQKSGEVPGKESTGDAAGSFGGPAAGVMGQTADDGKEAAEEAKDAASPGAQEPPPEKKGEVLNSIREGTKEGIKKLFKW